MLPPALRGYFYEHRGPYRDGYIDSRNWDPNWKHRSDWQQLYRFLRLFLPDTEAMTVASAESYNWGARYGGFSYNLVRTAVKDIQKAFRHGVQRVRAATLIQRLYRNLLARRTYDEFDDASSISTFAG